VARSIAVSRDATFSSVDARTGRPAHVSEIWTLVEKAGSNRSGTKRAMACDCSSRDGVCKGATRTPVCSNSCGEPKAADCFRAQPEMLPSQEG